MDGTSFSVPAVRQGEAEGQRGGGGGSAGGGRWGGGGGSGRAGGAGGGGGGGWRGRLGGAVPRRRRRLADRFLARTLAAVLAADNLPWYSKGHAHENFY